MRLHVEALFTLSPRGRLVFINDDAGTQRAPRFLLGCTSEGPRCWFRDDVDDKLAVELEALSRGTGGTLGPIDPAPFAELLSAHDPVVRVWSGPAFWCPGSEPPIDPQVVTVTPDNAAVLRRHLSAWVPDVAPDTPMPAALHDGAAVSVCCSVRRTRRAHEAGVETHRDFRGRGFASAVVGAWAEAVRETGALPLYSTAWTNDGSRGVARRLGLVHFGSDMHVT
jgi:GNAT superfamily N-acetyltransferase